MEKLILIIAFYLIYYNLCGLATTNIIRLTKGNTLPILYSKCECGNCGAKINIFQQRPIISYILCKGRCRSCKTKIPIDSLLLEITILLGMFMISLLFSFSYIGVSLSFVYYEIIRVIWIIKNGRRSNGFVSQYTIAVLAMIPFYLMTMFVALLYNTIVIL